MLCCAPAKQLSKGRNPSIPTHSQQHSRDQRAPKPTVGDIQVRDPLWGHTGPEPPEPLWGTQRTKTLRVIVGIKRTRAPRTIVETQRSRDPQGPLWGHTGPGSPRAHPEGPQDWTPPWPTVGDNAHNPSRAGQDSRQGCPKLRGINPFFSLSLLDAAPQP